MGDCHNVSKERLFFFGGAGSPAPDPVRYELHSCRLQGPLHSIQCTDRHPCSPVLGFETAHSGNGDMRPLGEVPLLEAEQRAGSSYLFGLDHDVYISL